MNRSTGLGDTIENITKKTGIKKVIKVVTAVVGIDNCGCDDRKDTLNRLFPYSKNN